MGHAISAVVVIVMMMLTGVLLHESFNRGTTQAALATKLAEKELAERRVTSIELKNVSTTSGGTPVTMDVENTGSLTLSHIDEMDLIVDYPDTAGDRVIKRLTYVESSPGADEWDMLSIAPDATNPDLLDPGETMSVEFHLQTPIPSGESGVVKLVTENGMSHQAIFGW